MLSPSKQGLKGRGDKGVPSWLWCVWGGATGLALTGSSCAGVCMCVHRRATLRARTWPPFLLFHTAFISLVTLECLFFFFFSFFLFIFISPQMSIFPDLSNACSAAGGEEGAFALSLSLPLASSAPAALLASFYFLQS